MIYEKMFITYCKSLDTNLVYLSFVNIVRIPRMYAVF